MLHRITETAFQVPQNGHIIEPVNNRRHPWDLQNLSMPWQSVWRFCS